MEIIHWFATRELRDKGEKEGCNLLIKELKFIWPEGMKVFMSKDLQFYGSSFRAGPNSLVRTIYHRVKSAEQFGSSTARILLRHAEKSHKD